MNPILIDLGFIQIHWYSVMILLGFIIGGYLVMKEAKKFHIPDKFMDNLFVLIVIFAIIGARLYYVIFNFESYNNILDIFKIWEGGLAIHGGIIAGIIVIILYSKKYKISYLRILDIMAVGLIIGQAIGRWGNFFNQEAHGGIVSLEFLNSLHLPKFIIDGMNIGGNYYHPTFLYESLWCVIGFVILLIIRRVKKIKIGQITSIYLMWYSLGRFFIESLRTDSLMFFNLRIAQVVSIILFIIGLILFIIRIKKEKYEEEL